MTKKENVELNKQQAAHHGKMFEQMVAIPAYTELKDKFDQRFREYLQLKQECDIEEIIRDPLRLQFLVDCERRVKYQLEIFNYINSTIKLGQKCVKELNAGTPASK